MIAAAIREHFKTLLTREIEYPGTGPNGEKYLLEISPHDTPEYLDAIADLGVVPRPYDKRGADPMAQLTAAFMGRGENGNQEDADEGAAATERLALDREEIVAAGFQHHSYDPCYSVSEGAAVAPAVCEHLVKGLKVVSPDGDSIPQEADDVWRWFMSTEKLPQVMNVMGEDGKDVPRTLYMGGHPEGAVIALVVLRAAVQEHTFKQRLVPLSKASGLPEESKATTPPEPDSATASDPA